MSGQFEIAELLAKVDGSPVGAGDEQATSTRVRSSSGIEHVLLAIDNLSCGSCALRAERAIARAPGVISVSVNLLLGSAVVELDHSLADIDAVLAELASEGYRGRVVDDAAQGLELPRDRLALRVALTWAGALALLGLSLLSPLPLLAALLGSAVVLLPGWPIIGDALGRARRIALTGNALKTIGALGACGVGWYVYGRAGGAAAPATVTLLFEAGAAIIAGALLSQLLERRAAQRAQLDMLALIASEPTRGPLLREAHGSKASRQRIVDAVLRVLVPLSLVLAALVLFARQSAKHAVMPDLLLPSLAMLAAIAPATLGVAVALASVAGIQRGAASGVLFRGAESVERLADAQTLALSDSVVAENGVAKRGVKRLSSALRALGVEQLLLSSLSEPAARKIARGAALDNVLAALRPGRRVSELNSARGDGQLALLGDPKRDADLLAAADVGVVLGSSQEAGRSDAPAGLWLARGRLDDLALAIETARATRRVASQNAAIAIAWHLMLLGAAALGVLGPHAVLIAAGASTLLSSTLAANARRLRGSRSAP